MLVNVGLIRQLKGAVPPIGGELFWVDQLGNYWVDQLGNFWITPV